MPGEDIVLIASGGRHTATRVEDNTHRYANASNAVAVGDVVCISGNNTVAKADRDDVSKVPPIGVVVLLDGTDNCYVVHSGGIASNLSNLTAGTTYWLSDTAGGLVTQPARPEPPNPLPKAFLIGVAISASKLLVTCIPFDLYE